MIRSVYIPDEMAEKIKAVARVSNITFNRAVRELLKLGLKAVGSGGLNVRKQDGEESEAEEE